MTTPGVTPIARPARRGVVLRVLALATAALLAVDAYVHLDDAHLYREVATSSLSQATLFRVEAIVAIVVAVVLVIWPHPVVWVVAALVAGSAAGAVFLYTYVDVGTLGPLPDMYEPTWALPGKRLSGAAEIAATVLAVVGFLVAVRRRHRPAPRH
jgi:predicted pyridoxine 5'-phosphate oxidase superfamily flavin-nucleotide-binding protein